MFNDFLNLNYWKTKNKLRTLREVVNRISMPQLDDKLNNLVVSINSINALIDKINDNKDEDDTTRHQPPDINVPPGDWTTCPPLPDLIVKSISSSTHDKYIDFAITVENHDWGRIEQTASIKPCKLRVRTTTDYSVLLDVPPLALGETVTLHQQYSFDPDATEEIEKTIYASVDINLEVDEVFNNNNNLSKSFTVKEPYIAPPGKAYLIFHMHNPEGKEIGSILQKSKSAWWRAINNSGMHLIEPTQGMDFDYFIPTSEATHAIPIEVVVEPGGETWTFEAKFNGMTLYQTVDIVAGDVKEIFFVFPRIEPGFLFTVSGGTPPNTYYVDETTFSAYWSSTFGKYYTLVSPIPSSSIITRWYGQGLLSAYYPSLYISTDYITLQNITQGRSFGEAGEFIIGLNVTPNSYVGGLLAEPFPVGNHSYTGTAEWHITSTPYDLDETAV